MAKYIVTEKSVALRYFMVEANSAEEAYQMWEDNQCSDCCGMEIEYDDSQAEYVCAMRTEED